MECGCLLKERVKTLSCVNRDNNSEVHNYRVPTTYIQGVVKEDKGAWQ